MKTVRVDYNLQSLTQNPQAHLSDLFVLLYSMRLIESRGIRPSRYSLNKLFPYVFTKLEATNKLDSIWIFNLPFYRMKGGHYNRSMTDKYLKKLLNAGLIEESDTDNYSYKLKNKATKIIDSFVEETKNKSDNKLFESLVNDFITQYLQNRGQRDIYEVLRAFSHTTIVEDDNQQKTVDELEIDDYKAISYNGLNFAKGKKSSLVPSEYLTALAYSLRKHSKASEQDMELVNSLLST